MSSVDAYKIEQEKSNFRGAGAVWKSHPEWRHIECYVDPKLKCVYCGFLGFGHTTIAQLESGVSGGRQCCNIILEAVSTWHRHSVQSLTGVQIFAWERYAACADRDTVGCNILLRWPQEPDDAELLLTKNITRKARMSIDIFRSGSVVHPYDLHH